MLKELRKILDSIETDGNKLRDISELVARCYSQDEYKDMLLAAKGPVFDFEKTLRAMGAPDLIGLLRASELDPQEYEHLDSSTDPEAIIDFIMMHKDYLNFDFGGHFTPTSSFGTQAFNITKTVGGKPTEPRTSTVFKLGESLGLFREYETVFVLGSEIVPRMTVNAMIDGRQVRCKTVRQPNPFQWAVEFQEDGKRRVEFVEVRDITPIVNTQN